MAKKKDKGIWIYESGTNKFLGVEPATKKNIKELKKSAISMNKWEKGWRVKI